MKAICAALFLSLVLAAAAQARPVDLAQPAPLGAYRGAGSWVSIYDTAAWNNPARVVAKLKAHHVPTLYLETSNDRQVADVMHPGRIAEFLDRAQAANIDVVGWYLPSFANNRRDVRRALAGARFIAPSGNRFDAYALDIESTKIRSIPLRTKRAVAFAGAVRRGLPERVALGAITPDPVGQRYWPSYPFARLARSIDVFLPMAYFTARTSGPARVRRYSAANVEAIRKLVGDTAFPVHPIGGESRTATLAELRAFIAASDACGSLGSSLWEYGETKPSQWRLLASL